MEWTADARKITYYDALMRPQLQHTYDNSNTAGTLSAVRMTYDTNGRLAFQSYPSADVTPPAQGIWTQYDVLDRVTSVSQDSEHGPLVTLTEYLAGHRTRVTNPRSSRRSPRTRRTTRQAMSFLS